jgi:putative Mg2+ transporter-C (MgtC) family protein
MSYNPLAMDWLKDLLGHATQRAEVGFLTQTLLRLTMAAVLGGAIGLEREIKGKPAGLRTNMFICFGAAMFTILSFKLADQFGGDHTRIAAQIIAGIGFIGAGSILHSRNSVSGLTTAATIFVVASIGMACGAGLYTTAIFATTILLIALTALGALEDRFNLKQITMVYEARGQQAEEIISNVNKALEQNYKLMQSVQIGRTDGHLRVQFAVGAKRSEHEAILKRLRETPGTGAVECLGETDHE